MLDCHRVLFFRLFITFYINAKSSLWRKFVLFPKSSLILFGSPVIFVARNNITCCSVKHMLDCHEPIGSRNDIIYYFARNDRLLNTLQFRRRHYDTVIVWYAVASYIPYESLCIILTSIVYVPGFVNTCCLLLEVV